MNNALKQIAEGYFNDMLTTLDDRLQVAVKAGESHLVVGEVITGPDYPVEHLGHKQGLVRVWHYLMKELKLKTEYRVFDRDERQDCKHVHPKHTLVVIL